MSCESSADPKRATSGVSSVRFACKSRQLGSQSALGSYTRLGFSVDLRSYDPGQITDQFVPLYRTEGTGFASSRGGADDGTGSERSVGAPPLDAPLPASVAPPEVALVSAEAVPAEKPAFAATAANAKSASRRVRSLAPDRAASPRVAPFSEGTSARATTPVLRCRRFSTRDDRAEECVFTPARHARVTPLAAVAALAAAHDIGIFFVEKQ